MGGVVWQLFWVRSRLNLDYKAALSIMYVQLLRKVRRFSVGFSLSYRLFLFSLIAAVLLIAVIAFGFGVLHQALNPQLSATDLGLWATVAVTGGTAMFLGSRRKQLDSSLTSILPNAGWRFYGQRGCGVLTYMAGRFFLTEVGKSMVAVLAAAGVYAGFIFYGASPMEPMILAAIVLCPLCVALVKVCYDLTVLLRRYAGRNSARLRGFAGLLLVISFVLLGFFIIRSIYLGISEDGDVWALVTWRLQEDLPVVLLVVAAMFMALAAVGVQAMRLLSTICWAEVTGQQLEKRHVFRRLPELSEQWFKAIVTVDWRRTVRSLYERMLPINRVMAVSFILYIAVAWWMAGGAFEVVPRDVFDVAVPYGAGIAQAAMLCASVSPLFSMDADRYAYMLWRTTDTGFKRVLKARSVVMSLVLYGMGCAFILLFCVVTGLTYLTTGMLVSLAAATVLGTLQMLVVSARWPHLEWKETTDIERVNPPNMTAVAFSSLFLYGIVFLCDGFRFVSWGQNLAFGLFLLAFVPVASMGLSLVGYHVLRKGIRAC